MAELFKYICKSCGANLDPTNDEKVIKCAFCGSVYDRTAVLDEQQRRAADELADKTEKYKSDLMTYNALKSSELALADEVTRLSQTPTELPLWFVLRMPIQIISAVFLLIMLFIGIRHDSKLPMVLGGVIFAAVTFWLISVDIKKKQLTRSAEQVKSDLRSKLEELTSARAQLDDFQRGFDIGFIAEGYRDSHTLDYLIGLLRTYQASKLGEAYHLFDLHEHFTKMEMLQSEQVQVQKQQLEVMQQLADYDFDDTYDDDDFTLHETLKAFRENQNDDI